MLNRFTAKMLTSIIFVCFSFSIHAATISEMIVVDQIGYRTNSEKWFMIKNPITGYDSAITYVPGATVQLRRTSDNAVMQTITLSQWNAGATDTVYSGDQVWQGNFSSFVTPGTYHIFDTTNNTQSYNFDIGDNVFNGALAASVKSYYYNRSNIAISTGTWTHPLDHAQQQTARLYDSTLGGDQGASTNRDIRKGWFDAGDYRKYTAWMSPVIWDLAYAYEWYPDRFSDSTGIPESGNGVPDILDEIKWELDWLLNMQRGDGALYSGCFVVVGINGSSGGEGNPALDDRPYFYANFSTAATASGAAAFAIGARLFAAYTGAYPGYSTTLQTAAGNAWTFLAANPNNILYSHTNIDNADANQNDGAEKRLRFLAAAELYRATGSATYRTYCDANYNNANTNDGTYQPINSNAFMPGAGDVLKRGLVSYAMAAGATASVVTAIRTSVQNGADWYITPNLVNCPYRSYMWPGHYTWGSNGMKADWGNIAMYAVNLNVAPANNAAYRAAAEEYLHYFHGRNATAYSYLSQSQLFGADKSITQFFHSWFADGTVWDTNPAPGFLTGGPNQFYSVNTVSPPYGQLPMKAYLDWNKVWPDSSWEVTENSTGYQSRHVLLNAAFAGSAGTPTFTPTNTAYAGSPTFTRTRTRTPTNTPYYSPTATPTATTPPPFLLIYDGDTAGNRLADGTVNNGAPGTMTETTGGNPGNLMRLTYTTIAGWWQEHWWDKTANVNIGANTELVFNVRQAPTSPGTVSQFLVRINWSANNPDAANYLDEGGGITTAWKTARIPLSALLDVGQTVIDLIDFIASWNADYTVDVDNIRLEGAAPSPTRTFTNTPAGTATFTRTNTAVNTATFTRTATPVNTASATASVSPSNTYTRTPTNTAVNTATFTRTATPVNTATNTATFTRTITPVNSATNTAVNTVTFTRTGTPVNTATNTAVNTVTLTRTPAPTFTNTVIVTPTFTSTRTNTNTPLPSPTATPTFTYTGTGTFTATGTWTRTVTASATPTYTNTLLPTPSFTHTASFTRTVSPSRTGTRTATSTWTVTVTLTNSPVYSPTETSTGTPPTATSTPTVTVTPVLAELDPLTMDYIRWPIAACNLVTDPIVARVWVQNLGPVASGPFVLDLEGNTVTVANIPAMTSMPVLFYGVYLPSLPNTISVDVDADVQEQNESNNVEVFNPAPVPPPVLCTDTATPVNTVTLTATVTNTFTRTPTGTVSNTNTPVNTATRTVTPTYTRTSTPAVTATNTAQGTYTNTPFITATNTAVNTATRTVTMTLTAVPTVTSSVLPSATASPVNTATLTLTLVPSATNTRTMTVTLTRTVTQTVMPPATPTFTATAGPAGEIGIVDVRVYPNPVRKTFDPLTFLVQFTGIPAKVTLKIYTTNFRRVIEETWDSGLTYPACSLSIAAAKISRLSNGNYYYIIEAEDGSRKKAERKISVLTILR